MKTNYRILINKIFLELVYFDMSLDIGDAIEKCIYFENILMCL